MTYASIGTGLVGATLARFFAAKAMSSSPRVKN